MRTMDPSTTLAVAPPEPAGSHAVLPRSIVLLGGKLRKAGLSAAAHRSLLDLPVNDERTVLDVWRDRVLDFARERGARELKVQVLVDSAAPSPTIHSHERVAMEVERDAAELRGTGGALADLAARYQDDDWVLVASGAQVLLEPIAELVADLADTGGDVALISHHDGTPSGLMLIRSQCLSVIPKIGYSDMKEQALPQIAKRFDVRVVHRDAPTGLPIRTAADYIKALRHYHQSNLLGENRSDPFAEDWQPCFRIVEPGARIHPNARVYDSVVLKGATIGAGAVVVRSVVCAGATIGRDEQRLDQLVAPGV